MKNHIEIGFIKKPKGLKGEVVVVLHDNDSSFLAPGDGLGLDEENQLIIKSLKKYRDAYIFTFEGVEDRNQSDLLKGKKLFISNELAVSLNNDEEVFLVTLLGYNLFNNGKQVGEVSGFSKTKAHDLVRVRLNDGAVVEVPWVENFIGELDHTKKNVHLNAPDELLDANFLEPGKKS